MPVLTGLDRLLSQSCAPLKGKRIGYVCNQASITRGGVLGLDALIARQDKDGFEIGAVFGPQHGIWGHTQDNMIEWEGYRDPRTGLPFYSLYGEHREPTDAMLSGLDLLVIDIVDIGVRYYTFIWTMTLCMKACERLGIPVLILDRPNPIGGTQVEGTVLDPAYASFVGLHPLPMRHGMTAGEISQHMQRNHHPGCDLSVLEVQGWDRAQYHDETGLLWAMPSPNMPTVDTAVVYPGQCLLEGTKLSEGRGTTRPFESFGAPFIDGWKLADSLNAIQLPGVFFRPVQFMPTFQKFKGEVCQGCFIHVTDRRDFRPVLSTVAILQEVVRHWPDEFRWQDPPYEYETVRLPFDILAGNGWLRPAIEGLTRLGEIGERMDGECRGFVGK
ncbi:MAG: DUF1343 domain-containing protein [Fimbriimonadaceae bacterium]|nr:DUF1343 domain-containing protein [Fimbriimonadaceae bacterium]